MTTLRHQALTALIATLLLATAPIAAHGAEPAAGTATGTGAGKQATVTPDQQAPTQNQPPTNPLPLPQDQTGGGGNKVVQAPKDPYKLDPGKGAGKDFEKDTAKLPGDSDKSLHGKPGSGADKVPPLVSLPKAPDLPKTGELPAVQKTQALAAPQGLGNLNALRSVDQLFANSRGGDHQVTAVLFQGGSGSALATPKDGAAPNQDTKANPLPLGPNPTMNPLGPATQGVQAVTVAPGSLGGLQSVLNSRPGVGNTQLDLIHLQNVTNKFNKVVQDQITTVKTLGDTAKGTIRTIK